MEWKFCGSHTPIVSMLFQPTQKFGKKNLCPTKVGWLSFKMPSFLHTKAIP